MLQEQLAEARAAGEAAAAQLAQTAAALAERQAALQQAHKQRLALEAQVRCLGSRCATDTVWLSHPWYACASALGCQCTRPTLAANGKQCVMRPCVECMRYSRDLMSVQAQTYTGAVAAITNVDPMWRSVEPQVSAATEAAERAAAEFVALKAAVEEATSARAAAEAAVVAERERAAREAEKAEAYQQEIEGALVSVLTCMPIGYAEEHAR